MLQEAIRTPIRCVLEKETESMTQQLLRTDLADATKLSLDDYGEGKVRKIAVEGYVQAVEAWGLADSDAEKMLDVDHRTWMQIKNETWSGSFDREHLTRIGVVVAIYDALHSYFGDYLADRWITLPHKGETFSGRKPIEVMIEGGLPMMMETRDYVYKLQSSM